jgi:hypothetical protein
MKFGHMYQHHYMLTHCHLMHSPEQWYNWLLSEGRGSKNCEMYSESTFCIAQDLGSYWERQMGRCSLSSTTPCACESAIMNEWGTHSVMHSGCHNNSSTNAQNHKVCTCKWGESNVLTYKCLTTKYHKINSKAFSQKCIMLRITKFLTFAHHFLLTFKRPMFTYVNAHKKHS